MGGPSGVTDSHSIELRAGPVAHQPVESAHPTDRSQPHYVSGAGLQRNTHGVVTTVFESTERDAQVIERRPLCAASDYAAHCCFPWFAFTLVNSLCNVDVACTNCVSTELFWRRKSFELSALIGR
jgi:hypothetical protein